MPPFAIIEGKTEPRRSAACIGFCGRGIPSPRQRLEGQQPFSLSILCNSAAAAKAAAALFICKLLPPRAREGRARGTSPFRAPAKILRSKRFVVKKGNSFRHVAEDKPRTTCHLPRRGRQGDNRFRAPTREARGWTKDGLNNPSVLPSASHLPLHRGGYNEVTPSVMPSTLGAEWHDSSPEEELKMRITPSASLRSAPPSEREARGLQIKRTAVIGNVLAKIR